MENAPVSTAIIRLSLPMMAAMLSQAIYFMTDIFFIGKIGDPNVVAAVNIVYPIFMLSLSIGTIFSIGGSSYISRMLGQEDITESQKTSSVCFYFSLISGLFFAVLLVFFKTYILKNIGTSEKTFTHTDSYYSIFTLFFPFSVANIFLSGLLRSEGATSKAMVLQLIGIVINIMLDPILIFVLNWGIKGAVWATVTGQLASFSYGIWYLLGKEISLSISFKNNKPNNAMLRNVFFIGVPAGLSNFLMSLAFILKNRIAASYGDHVVAGSGIQHRLIDFFILIVIGLTMGYQPFAGFNFGAKNIERLRKGFIFTMFSSTAICFIGCVLFFAFDKHLIGFFINDEQTIEAGAIMLRAFIIGLFFIGIHSTLMTTYQALGKSIEATILTFGRQLLVYFPLLYILNSLFGFSGFILALPLTDVFTAIIALGLSGSFFRLIFKTK